MFLICERLHYDIPVLRMWVSMVYDVTHVVCIFSPFVWHKNSIICNNELHAALMFNGFSEFYILFSVESFFINALNFLYIQRHEQWQQQNISWNHEWLLWGFGANNKPKAVKFAVLYRCFGTNSSSSRISISRETYEARTPKWLDKVEVSENGNWNLRRFLVTGSKIRVVRI